MKTTYYRLKARRQTHDGYDLLHQAAVVQFGAGQFTCGVELAKLLLEVWHADTAQCRIPRSMSSLRLPGFKC